MTLIIASKNRKNSLRENLHSEQLNFIAKLTTEFYHLLADLIKIKSGIKIDRIEIHPKVENVFGVMFSNTHIGSDNILIKASTTLSAANEFVKIAEENNPETTKANFEVYFKNYNELINIMRNEMGVHSLSKENENLFN